MKSQALGSTKFIVKTLVKMVLLLPSRLDQRINLRQMYQALVNTINLVPTLKRE